MQIGDYMGQFVEGTWIQTDSASDDSTNTVTSDVEWRESASARRLRWIEDGILYEIMAMGGSENYRFIGQEQMIDIALSLE